MSTERTEFDDFGSLASPTADAEFKGFEVEPQPQVSAADRLKTLQGMFSMEEDPPMEGFTTTTTTTTEDDNGFGSFNEPNTRAANVQAPMDLASLMKTAYSQPATELTKDDSWDFGIKEPSSDSADQVEEGSADLSSVDVAWPVSACTDIDESLDQEARVAALIAQERFTEALALSSESTEEAVAPEGHVMLADMIAAIEANCDEASKANFMTNFSQDDLNRCGKSNLAGAVR